MRAALFVLVGLAAGLAAGWALFAADPAAGRATRSAAARDAQVGAWEAPAEARGAQLAGEAETREATAPKAPVPGSDEAVVRRLMRETYDAQVKGKKAPEPDVFEAAVREAMRRTIEYRDSYARSLGVAIESRERMRAEVGEIAGSPLLLQISTANWTSVRLVERGNSAPFRVEGLPARGDNVTHVTGGMVPPGRMFLIERVVLRGYLDRRGEVIVAVPETDELKWDQEDRGKNVVAAELKGLVHLRHGYENSVRLRGSVVAASLEIHGRLVPEEEGESTPTKPLVMGDGWLTGEPVVMQVLADHGGGNDRTVYLGGKLYRIDSLEPESIWQDAPNLRDRRGSIAYYRGCGRVPPGKAFRVTRVEYRARLDPQERDHSRLSVRIGGQEQVKADASQGGSVAGAWTGDVLILPGREDDVSVTCNYYGLAEITVYGELVDDLRSKR